VQEHLSGEQAYRAHPSLTLDTTGTGIVSHAGATLLATTVTQPAFTRHYRQRCHDGGARPRSHDPGKWSYEITWDGSAWVREFPKASSTEPAVPGLADTPCPSGFLTGVTALKAE
jgi:hypothetical protein